MIKFIEKKLLVSTLLIFLTFASYGQENGRPNLSLGESFYLLKYGLGDTYKWDNVDANNLINLSLKNRKTSNTLLYGGAGISAIALILEFFVFTPNGFNLNRFDKTEDIIPTSVFYFGGILAGAGGIIRLHNHKKLKLANSKLNLR